MKQYIIILALLVCAFAAGRYTNTPVSTKTIDKTISVETDHTAENIHVSENVNKIETHKPDGTVTIETIIRAAMDSNKQTDKKETVKKDVTTTIESKKQSLTIDVLASVDTTKPFNLVYGAHIANQLIGPIRIGVFGFTNRQIGVSLGLVF